MRILLLGAPDCGKGTQAKLLAQQHRVPRLSAGALLRAAAAADTLPPAAATALAAGRMLKDDAVMPVLDERLRARDTKRGFILDGMPRNIPQAQALDALLDMLARPLQIAVYVQVSEEVLIQRISGRMHCVSCGVIYNRHGNAPTKRGVCDHCGGNAISCRVRRSSAEKRVPALLAAVAPLVAYYKAQHKLRTVQAAGGVEEIRRKIGDIVDLEIRPLEIKTLETAAETQHLGAAADTIIAGGQVNRILPEPPEPSVPPAPSARSASSAPTVRSVSSAPSVPSAPSASSTPTVRSVSSAPSVSSVRSVSSAPSVPDDFPKTTPPPPTDKTSLKRAATGK